MTSCYLEFSLFNDLITILSKSRTPEDWLILADALNDRNGEGDADAASLWRFRAKWVKPLHDAVMAVRQTKIEDVAGDGWLVQVTSSLRGDEIRVYAAARHRLAVRTHHWATWAQAGAAPDVRAEYLRQKFWDKCFGLATWLYHNTKEKR